MHLSHVILLDADPNFYLVPCSVTDNDLTSYPHSPCDVRLSAHLSVVINVTMSRVCVCVFGRISPVCRSALERIQMEDKRSVSVSAGLCSSLNWIN